MWLVLCEASDLSALWAYQGLQARGLHPLELVSADMLAYSLRWVHRLGVSGVTLEITLADGRTLRNEHIRGVLNRLVAAPSQHLQFAHLDDRQYATQEFSAFFLSWLAALPSPVLNRPTPQGLSGQWRHLSEWTWLAAQADLPTATYRQSSRDPVAIPALGVGSKPHSASASITLIVMNGEVFGTPVPPNLQRGCQRLAQLTQTALLGVEFLSGADGAWTFAGASPLPDLRVGGYRLIDALVAVLQGKTEGNV